MKDTKQQWFKEAKFGLFIHWDYMPFWLENTRDKEQNILQSGL